MTYILLKNLGYRFPRRISTEGSPLFLCNASITLLTFRKVCTMKHHGGVDNKADGSGNQRIISQVLAAVLLFPYVVAKGGVWAAVSSWRTPPKNIGGRDDGMAKQKEVKQALITRRIIKW